MARTIYINTDNGSIESAPVAGLNRPSARVPLREIVAGTTETYNLYLVKSDGTYDSRSGSGAVSVNVAIGQRAQTATSGNFTVTDSSGTSAEISATASAQAVEDVLNAMNSGTGVDNEIINYASTDGVDDKAINADCSVAGDGVYYLTAWIRSTSTGNKWAQTSNNDAIKFVTTVTNQWEFLISTVSLSGGSPSSVLLGSADATFPIQWTAADWSDVKLYKQVGVSQDTSVDTVVANWPLNEQSSGSLDGVTAVDSLGTYDGTYDGCAGGNSYIDGVSSPSKVDVQKLGSGIWLATWRENGARTVLTGASVDLTPESVVVPSISVTGDASSKCQQLIEVNRQPAIFQDTWSTIANGFSGTLDADVGRIVQTLNDSQSIDFYFEVRIDDDAICSTPIRVLAPVGGAASVSSAAPYGGTLASDPANYPGFSVSAWESALSIEGFSAIAPDDEAIIRGNGTEWVKASNFRVDAGTANSGTEMGAGTADGAYAVAEGSSTTASGDYSHAEGFSTTASGGASHAEGSSTTASGSASHAEGRLTTASGVASHAEGFSTTASGSYSHAEGGSTTASGNYSSATGRRGKAIHDGARVEADSQDADVSSTTTNQFTARFQNGYEFKGGLAAFEGGASFGDATTQATTRANLGVAIYGQLYFSATAATTIAVAGTYVKLAGTTTSDSLNGITMPQNNRLQNNSGTTRVFQAMARADIIDGSGNKNIAIKLAKNGILIDATESNGETTNNVAAHTTINWIVSLAAGEYVEIWATNESDTSSITAQHGHLFLKAID